MSELNRDVERGYSSDIPSGNFASTAQIQFLSRPLFGLNLVIDPLIGYEFGKNLKKPETLFGQMVDFSQYDYFGRLLFGGTARYYVFQPKVTATDVYRLVFSMSWQARALSAEEPFVQSESVTDATGKVSRQKVLTMKAGMRHYVEAGLTWNLSPFVGLDVKYKRGSLPPLFQFVDPHFIVGVTFKTKIGTDLPR